MIRGRQLMGAAIAVAVLGAAVGATRLRQPAGPAALVSNDPAAGPTMAPAGTLSAAWYCPGGPSAVVDQSDVGVTMVNTTARSIQARLTALPAAGSGPPVERTVDVPALGSTTVRLAEVLKATRPTGASVVGPGGLVVQQSIKTPEGAAFGPCASAASERWYAAAGSTAANTTLLLPLLNPFPDDAIVDFAFSTEQGRAVPGDLQGIVVPGRSVLIVNVGDHVRRRDAVSAEIVARRGRLVVGRNFRKGTGSSTALAAPSAAAAWYVPGGVRAEGVSNRLVVANPSDQDAEVSAELRLQEGAIEPFTLRVPAQDRAELNLDDARVPKGVPYSIAVRSTSEVPIVVERSTEGKAGRSDVLGGRIPDRAWWRRSPGPAARTRWPSSTPVTARPRSPLPRSPATAFRSPARCGSIPVCGPPSDSTTKPQRKGPRCSSSRTSRSSSRGTAVTAPPPRAARWRPPLGAGSRLR